MSRPWWQIRSPLAAGAFRRTIRGYEIAGIVYALGGNDVNGVDCSGLFTYAMSDLNVEYTDRSTQELYDDLFTLVRPAPFGPTVRATFYGPNISTLGHVVFHVHPNSDWIIHSTDQLSGHQGVRGDRLRTLRSLWSQNWYSRYIDVSTLYADQF